MIISSTKMNYVTSGESMNKIIKEYFSLLEQELIEQKYQSFIESNTQFIPRHFVQNHGIHFNLLLRKYKISNDMITDFVFLSKSSIDWNYVLIEIEKPQSKFFKSGSLDIHNDFLKGITQIKFWQAWFKQSENKAHFEQQLEFLKKPTRSTQVSIKYILVTGRRHEYEKSNEKINIISSYEDPDFKIMSFDSLAENINEKNELYLGVRKQRSVEIKSKKFLGENILLWCDESDFHLNNEIKKVFIKEIDNKIHSLKKDSILWKLGGDNLIDLKNKINNMKVIK